MIITKFSLLQFSTLVISIANTIAVMISITTTSEQITEDTTAVANSTEDLTTDLIKQELGQFNSNELNLVPKKPNWDLKNQIADKLEKLRKRTQR